MELHLVDTEGIPEGCVLSVRAGSTRRQAPVAADRPFRFPTSAADSVPFKVDVLEPVASARLILRPGEELRQDCQYTLPLELARGDGLFAKDMSVTVAVGPLEEELPYRAGADAEAPGAGAEGDASQKKASTASSRHGQASAAREYLDQHNLVEFTQLLVQSVIKEQPECPYAFMAKQFYFPEPEPRRRAGPPPAEGVPTADAAGAALATVAPAAPEPAKASAEAPPAPASQPAPPAPAPAAAAPEPSPQPATATPALAAAAPQPAPAAPAPAAAAPQQPAPAAPAPAAAAPQPSPDAPLPAAAAPQPAPAASSPAPAPATAGASAPAAEQAPERPAATAAAAGAPAAGGEA